MLAHKLKPKTRKYIDNGEVIFKIMDFHADISELKCLLRSLSEHCMITYSYIDSFIDRGLLHIERTKLIGTPLDELDSYPIGLQANFEDMFSRYEQACNLFETHGFGFIITDYRELSNFILTNDGRIEPIDFEDSFITTKDKDVFTQYWKIAAAHVKLELQRIKLLSEL